MTPSSLLSQVRSEIAKEREMLANATPGTWDWEYLCGGICAEAPDAMLAATRVNATKADLNAMEGAVALYEGLCKARDQIKDGWSLVSIQRDNAEDLLTNWLRERGVEVKGAE